MNPTRHVVPISILTARCRSTRPATAVVLLFAISLGAVGCGESGATGPLQALGPHTAAPDSLKQRSQPPAASAQRVSALTPSMSAAGAAAPGAMTVSGIGFSPEPGPFKNGGFETGDPSQDDDATWGGQTGFDIGFSFTFFGVPQTKFWIGSNAVILFRNADGSLPQQWGGCCSLWFPSDDDVNNVIALANTDLKPAPGQVRYETRGTAPNRRLIVNFDQVALYNESGAVTTQAILYEGTNVIEVHTASQPGTQWYTQGLENATGSQAVFMPGRVFQAYGLTNDAVRFTPVVENNPPTADAGGTAGTAPKYYEGTEGVAIQFSGRGADVDNDQLTYSWDFNRDGVADASTAAATYTYPDNGVYTATLTVQDGRGGIGQASVDVRVKNAAPVVNAANQVGISALASVAAVRINAGESLNLSGQFSDQGVNDALWHWTWNVNSQRHYFGTTQDQGAALVASHRFCTAGSFPVKLTVTDKDGSSGSDELLVTVDALSVQIDINPRRIVLNDRGLLTVRAYSRPGLDVTALNPSSIVLTNGSGKGTPIARTGGGLLHWNTRYDLNGDGLRDAIMLFRRDQLLANKDLQMGTANLMLKGTVGDCGDVLGSADVRVKVIAKRRSAGSSLSDEDSDSEGSP
jgi:PKD repeat protein